MRFITLSAFVLVFSQAFGQNLRFSYQVVNPVNGDATQSKLIVKISKIGTGTENIVAFNWGFYYKSSEATVEGFAAGATVTNMTTTQYNTCIDQSYAVSLGWLPEGTGSIISTTSPPGLPSGYDRLFIGSLIDGNNVGTNISSTPTNIIALLLDNTVGSGGVEQDSAYMAATDVQSAWAYSNNNFEEYSIVTTGTRLQALPIQLAFFNAAKLNEKHADLTWASVSETNSSHFEIERSLDSRNWQKIGQVDAAGYSNDLLRYSFLDANVFLGALPRLTVHYRLKMVDLDGRFDYSPIETLTFRSSQAREDVTPFVTYPNPAREGVTIAWDNNSIGQPTTIQVFDAAGRLVYLMPVAANSNQEYIDFAEAGIANGLCIARLLAGDQELDVKQIIIGQN